MSVAENSVVERMRRASLRQLVVIVFLDAVVLSAVSLLTTGARIPERTALAACVALALAIWPLVRADQLDSDLRRRPWLPVLGATLGAVALMLAAPARSTMFPAVLTPVGMCVLFGYSRQALLAASILTAGYLQASAQPGVHASLESVLTSPPAVFGYIAGGLLPIRIAIATLNARAANMTKSRAPTADRVAPGAPGRPGMAREHDPAILAGVLAGKSDKVIAFELKMGPAPWRVRYRRRRLQAERGVRDRHELAKQLHLEAHTGGP